MKKSCVIYATWADQILNLPNDLAGEYVKYILRYAIYGEEIEPDNPFISAMLVPVKKKLDEDNKKYNAQVERMNKNRNQSDVGMKSDRSQTEVNTKSIRSRNEVAHDTVTDTVTVTDNNKKNKKQSFRNFQERKYDYKELMKGTMNG